MAHGRSWVRNTLPLVATIRAVSAILFATTPGWAADIATRATQAFEKAQQGDCRSSLPILGSVSRDKAFASLNDAARLATYEVAVSCSYDLKDQASAYRYALEGTRVGPGSGFLWNARLLSLMNGDRLSDAVATLEAMGVRNPEALNGLRMSRLFSLYRKLKDRSEPALRERFLTVLTGTGYQPDELLATGDYFKRERASQLIAAGDRAGAAALVKRMTEPRILLDVSFDSRLRNLMAPDFDERAAAEKRLAQLREIAASHVNSLAILLELSRYQRILGQVEEALATLESARPDGPGGKDFMDLDEKKNWWWDEMARSYQMLGRYDDAVSAFGQGIAAKEDGSPNVSQTINLGHAHLRFGHPDLALKTVAVFDTPRSASPYGEMEVRLVRGCAQAALGEQAALADTLRYAREHERDHPEALTDLLLCVDDMDGAAASMIRRLDDPERRVDALKQLSTFDPPPPTYPQMPFEVKMADLKARADVQAAMQRAGGARRVHLQAREL